MRLIRKLLIFSFLFVIFYFEPVQIGPITFSQLWKIPFILYLIWQVLVYRKRKSRPAFIFWSYARGFKNLMNGGVLTNVLPEILDFIRYMMFPLMYEYLKIKVKSSKIYTQMLNGFAQFIILSGIPFVLGIIESKGKQLEFGEEFTSYVGLFQNPHASAITTAVAILVILAQLKTRQINYRLFHYFLVTIGIYLLFLSFVRTGYMMFIIGLIVLYKPSKLSARQLFVSTAVLAGLVVGFLYLLDSNELFYNRIFDIRNNQQTELGSGRLIFWSTTVNLWLSGGYFELLFGYGFDNLTSAIYNVTSLRVFSHSEIFTQLGQNGILGLFIFLFCMVSLLKFIWKRRQNESFKITITIYTLYISVMLTQGGVIFPFDVFMVIAMAKLSLETEEGAEFSLPNTQNRL